MNEGNQAQNANIDGPELPGYFGNPNSRLIRQGIPFLPRHAVLELHSSQWQAGTDLPSRFGLLVRSWNIRLAWRIRFYARRFWRAQCQSPLESRFGAY